MGVAWLSVNPDLRGADPIPNNAVSPTAIDGSQPADELAQTPSSPPNSTSTDVDATKSSTAGTSIAPADRYGLWTLAPAIVAILIAIFTRQVLLALPLGILTASAMMLFATGSPDAWNPIAWLTHAVDNYLFQVLTVDADGNAIDGKLKILVFTLFIGAMIGIIEANGGTRAMVARVTRHLATPRRGQLGAFLAGIVVFFDDYANAMIVGPAMRPIFDRLKISREKLAYIVDSTAAPVASVFIGTWLVAEISFIDEGLNALTGDRPPFLAGMDGFSAFWASLPYRTYAWLSLVLVFLIAVTHRDFGSMRTAENRAANDVHHANDPAESHPGNAATSQAELANKPQADAKKWWLGAIPIAVMVFGTIGLLFASGWNAFTSTGEKPSFDTWTDGVQSLSAILGGANSSDALLYAALGGTIIALVLTVLARTCTLAAAMDGMTEGMKRMFAACIVLTLAWGLTKASEDLELSKVAAHVLGVMEQNGQFDLTLLPTVTFIAAAIVSFATGTSWGTMGILCPVVVAISARLYGDLPEADALPLFYSTIGAVLTGAVFGDHCSPISDTTVMSSIASECDLGRHVWTQMPYAFVVAIVGLLCTDLLNFALIKWAPEFHEQVRNVIVYGGTLLGALILWLIVLAVGRKPRIIQPVPMRANVLEPPANT